MFLSDARPCDGDVATCINERLNASPLITNNYAGRGIVVGDWANFLYALIAFLFVCLRQLGTLPQPMPWVATTPTNVSWFPDVRI